MAIQVVGDPLSNENIKKLGMALNKAYEMVKAFFSVSDLYGDFSESVKIFDEAFESANRRSQQARDTRVIRGVNTDSYGFLNYGDGVHWVWAEGVDVPENIAWAGNYYGYPHMMCIQSIRTGNAEYFDNFEAHALHVADVHTVHYTEKEEIIYIKDSVDRMIAEGKRGGVDAQAYSFIYLKTGEEKYLDAAIESLPRDGQFEHRWKNYALAMRNAAMCIGDLYRAAQSSGDR